MNTPIAPIFAGMLWRTAKLMNDIHTLPPPTTEQRRCFACVGGCPICHGRGTVPVEVRREP